MAKWLAKEFDWDTGRYTGRYYDIAEAGIVAVFVDSFYGLDTNAGTAVAPFKTLGKAITTLNSTGADGSRIFMNGIFSETLPAQTYWYEFIGCGGGWNGFVIFSMNQITLDRIKITKTDSKWHNFMTLGYNDNSICDSNINAQCVNVFLQNCLIIRQYNNYLDCIFSVWKNVTINTISIVPFYNRLSYSILYNIKNLSGYTARIFGSNNYVLVDPESNTVQDQTTNSQWGTNAQFINPAQNDFNVRITSPLIGAGSVDEITGNPTNVGGVNLGLPYNGLTSEFSEAGGAIVTDLTIDATGKYTITPPATTGTLETALMDLGNIYPLENIDLFNVFDFAAGEITQGVFEAFSSPRMALTIKLKYGLTSAEVDDCPWLLIEYGKQPTFSGTGASRVGNADDTFDPDTFQTITCRYMKLFITLQNNS